MKRSFSELRKMVAFFDATTKNDALKVKKLLESSADPNSYLDSSKITPLHFAALYNSFDAAVLLINAGAIIDSKSIDDETPLEIATNHGYLKLAELFLNYENTTHSVKH